MPESNELISDGTANLDNLVRNGNITINKRTHGNVVMVYRLR